MRQPELGEIVLYRSRTGNYATPAIVVATAAEINSETPIIEMDEPQPPHPIDSEMHVHLVVLAPGTPYARDRTGGGTYREWNAPYDEDAPRSWRFAAEPAYVRELRERIEALETAPPGLSGA